MNLSLDSMSERERRMLTFGAMAAAVLLIFAVVLPLDRSVAKARERVAHKQADLAWMRSVQPELASAGPAASQQANAGSLLIVVDRSARESGLGSSLTSTQPSGPGRLQVRMEKASFDQLVGWLARLAEQNGVSVESATIDNAGEPGLVNAGLVLKARTG
jgi:general secretion pathway protein M